MLNQAFNEVYTKFKLHFYQEIFRRFQDREASLTTMETFCMESIMALGRPSVNEFATFMRISPPNAAYKFNSLVKKGYVIRERGLEDRRVVYISLSKRGLEAYEHHAAFHRRMVEAITQDLSEDEMKILVQALSRIDKWFRDEERV